jgi:tRNA(Ile)-lysidine synthase
MLPFDPAQPFQNLFDASGFALAVSGGADSTALLLLFARWRAAEGDTRPALVLTVDHQLRPESRGEAEAVARLAASLGLDHRTLVWCEAAPGPRLQERAREARRALLLAACREAELSHLLLAHHAADQAETVWMRLKRGSGVDGLAGMARRRAEDGITIARPLLHLSPGDLRRVCEEEGVRWQEDASNADPAFERVRARRELARLAEEGLLDPAALVRLATRARRAREALEEQAAALVARVAVPHPAGFCSVSLAVLARAPAELQLRALARVLAWVGGGRGVRLDRLEALLDDLQREGFSGASLAGCRLAPAGAGLLIAREARPPLPAPVRLAPGEALCFDGRMDILLAPQAPAPLALGLLGRDAISGALRACPAVRDIPPPARESLIALRRGEEIVGIAGLGEPPDWLRTRFPAVEGAGRQPAPDQLR